jgi:hypothetical protein
MEPKTPTRSDAGCLPRSRALAFALRHRVAMFGPARPPVERIAKESLVNN